MFRVREIDRALRCVSKSHKRRKGASGEGTERVGSEEHHRGQSEVFEKRNKKIRG